MIFFSRSRKAREYLFESVKLTKSEKVSEFKKKILKIDMAMAECIIFRN